MLTQSMAETWTRIMTRYPSPEDGFPVPTHLVVVGVVVHHGKSEPELQQEGCTGVDPVEGTVPAAVLLPAGRIVPAEEPPAPAACT